MYGRILAAVDGSAASDKALQHAVTLAREQGAALRVVHVRHENPYWYLLPYDAGPGIDAVAVQQRWRQAAQDVVDRAAARARHEGVEPEVAVLDGAAAPIATALVEDARSWGADLIVMGTHGRRGVEHLLLGSVAEMVARTASVPLLLLRAEKAAGRTPAAE